LLQHSQGKVPRNSGWDSNIDVVQGTGTVHSAVKPPSVAAARDKKSDSAYPNLTRKLTDGENHWMPASASALDESASAQKDAHSELDNKRLENSSDDVRFLFFGLFELLHFHFDYSVCSQIPGSSISERIWNCCVTIPTRNSDAYNIQQSK